MNDHLIPRWQERIASVDTLTGKIDAARQERLRFLVEELPLKYRFDTAGYLSGTLGLDDVEPFPTRVAVHLRERQAQLAEILRQAPQDIATYTAGMDEEERALDWLLTSRARHTQLIFGDLHGDLAALQTLQQAWADEYIALGDIMNYGNRPQEHEALRQVEAITNLSIRGNHEEAVLGKLGDDDQSRATRTIIEDMPAQAELGRFTYTHDIGFQRHEDKTIDRLLAVAESFHPKSVVLYAHTHDPSIHRIQNGRVEELPTTRSELDANGTYLINPGAATRRERTSTYAVIEASAVVRIKQLE